jgi:hypothetical protein
VTWRHGDSTHITMLFSYMCKDHLPCQPHLYASTTSNPSTACQLARPGSRQGSSNHSHAVSHYNAPQQALHPACIMAHGRWGCHSCMCTGTGTSLKPCGCQHTALPRARTRLPRALLIQPMTKGPATPTPSHHLCPKRQQGCCHNKTMRPTATSTTPSSTKASFMPPKTHQPKTHQQNLSPGTAPPAACQP